MHQTSSVKLIMSEVNNRNNWKIRLTWKLLKSVIFLVCVTCFVWQSANFFGLYFTYPTTTSVDLTFPEVLIKPAITFCNNNPVKRKTFCAEYPHLCQKPNNLTEFCTKHPYFCKADISNLVIPKLGYYASNSAHEVQDALMEIYIHNVSQDGPDLWSWKAPIRESKMKATFIYDYSRSVYVTCYSTNLHIYGSEEVETANSSGSAASAIKELELKDENYDSDLEILQSRYDNKDV
ncbi:uncharacterized protein NPIL_258481 [Nephila pilipes]|uniref:Uncharacterized protein n=1 Tax=Nephila pilipes TaxID=299642 RepID=A0A8X6R8T4_NEPPI|nr:uncharacterized protein NPIL_258481 [Nephila pilipes]